MTTATDGTSLARLATAFLAIGMTWAAAAHAGTEAARRPRLLYAEPLAPEWEVPARRHSGKAGETGPARLRFSAYGRAFDLLLSANTRIADSTAADGVEKGVIASVPGSWARLTRNGRALTGIIFDGREFFGIEPTADMLEFLDPDAPAPTGDNIVYRLSDLLLDREGLACGLGTGDAPVSAAAAINALASELSSPEAAAAIGPTRRVTLAPIADLEFSDRYGTNAGTEILARLNVIEGIFTEQVGLDIVAKAPQIFTSAAPPYALTATTASALLDQVSDYRLEVREDAGLTHLFSYKTLANRLVGIAWQGAVCLPREGAGLSTGAGITANISALVAAHEIGHNLGAPHDGESGSACASTPTTFLMAARTSGSSTFSPCSLEQMAPVIEDSAAKYPSCLTRLFDYDVGIIVPADVSGAPGTDIDVAITVRNYGTQTIAGVQWQFVTPAALTITSVSSASGACATLANRVDCDVGDLAGESSWEATVRVRSAEQRRYSVTASVAAASDEQSANNSTRLSVTVADPSQAASGGGGGGGGALDWLALLALALSATMHRSAEARFDRTVMPP